MILLTLMSKGSAIKINQLEYRNNNTKSHKVLRITKSQESNKPLKRLLKRINLWQKEFVPYFVNKA